MKIVGYERNDFTVRESGIQIKGCNVYVARTISAEKGKGQAVERLYMTDAKLAKCGLNLEAAMGKSVVINYNRYGKVESIVIDA